MTGRHDWAAELAATPRAGLDSFLLEHSGLPGPRANLSLVDAAARTLADATVLDLARSPEEYLQLCGTVGLGRLLLSPAPGTDALAMLRERAVDERWRVREGVAMALQLAGDADRAILREVVTDWVSDPHPLVRRAAVATVCEPRLLSDPATRQAALDVCRAATQTVRSTPTAHRTHPDLRTLRQALGYAWSVAVAASPAEGLAEIETLRADDDPDVAWILRSNLTKARLRRALETVGPRGLDGVT